MAQDLGQLTDMWMVNPSMFDPTQKSNSFSNYNNAALPWPPSYNGAPVNAATGQPIQSFQQWQQQNPGGMTLNATAPQAQAAAASRPGGGSIYDNAPAGGYGMAMGQGVPLSQFGGGGYGSQNLNDAAGLASLMGLDPSRLNGFQGGARQAAPQAAAPQASAAPNNWQAALNALANPGKVTTPGATVPLQTCYQPSGGVNAAFLQNAGAGQGMNQGFLSALRAIQGR